MKPFTKVSVAILAFIAVAHLLRIISGWEIVINGVHIPLWVSAVAIPVFSVLAWMLWRESHGRQ